MTEEQQKEQFSIAYVRAVAAVARVNIYRPEVDADSVDIGFSVISVAGQPQAPRIEAQLKCVTDLKGNETEFRYPLVIKNYNELVGEHFIPRILIVVLVPPSPNDWLEQNNDRLSLCRCGYWVSLRNLARSENDARVTVGIPRSQVFSPDVLRSLLPVGAS